MNLTHLFLVNTQHNLIVPYSTALKILDKLELPVYKMANGDPKCHFRDVAKKMIRLVFLSKNKDYNIKGIDLKQLKFLEKCWELEYPDLKVMPVLDKYHSGKYFSIQFIVKSLERAFKQKKFHREEADYHLNKIHTHKHKDKHDHDKALRGSKIRAKRVGPAPTNGVQGIKDMFEQPDGVFQQYVKSILK